MMNKDECSWLNLLYARVNENKLVNFTLGPDATLNTEIHENSVRTKTPNSVNPSKRNNCYNKQRRVLLANSTVCQSK